MHVVEPEVTALPDALTAAGQGVPTREAMDEMVPPVRAIPDEPHKEEDPKRPKFSHKYPFGVKPRRQEPSEPPSGTASGQRQEQDKSESDEEQDKSESDEERERSRNRPQSRGSESSDYQTAEEDSRSSSRTKSEKSNPMGADYDNSRDAASESSRPSSGARSSPRKRSRSEGAK